MPQGRQSASDRRVAGDLEALLQAEARHQAALEAARAEIDRLVAEAGRRGSLAADAERQDIAAKRERLAAEIAARVEDEAGRLDRESLAAAEAFDSVEGARLAALADRLIGRLEAEVVRFASLRGTPP